MIGFYLMTEKGFEVLRSVLQAYGAQAVSFVVAAKDAQLQKDYYKEIEMICREHSIPFFNRERKFHYPPASIVLLFPGDGCFPMKNKI